MTTGSCHGGLADQALKVRTLDISRDQKSVHNETSSTLLSLFQSSLLLEQSRTPLLPRIFSSFLLQDLLLLPSDPHHWFTGMPLLHKRAHMLEVMNLMKTLSMDCCSRRRYASVGHVMCHEFIGSIQLV
ncbi:multifunctional CCA protein [Trichinella spiralis]|uniref:multifunctional CCA protein n=1 Tax=Trichinella spiralis TaxID=6334 RepID=UPI0001EFD27A|nr:multifunctional CCA protein [Trichinella spiralis]